MRSFSPYILIKLNLFINPDCIYLNLSVCFRSVIMPAGCSPTSGQTWRREIRSHILGFLQATSGDELWWPQPSKAFTFSLRICLVCQVLPQVMNSILPDTWHRWADPARGRDRQHEWTCYQTSNQVQVTQLSLLLENSEHRWSPCIRHGRDYSHDRSHVSC